MNKNKFLKPLVFLNILTNLCKFKKTLMKIIHIAIFPIEEMKSKF